MIFRDDEHAELFAEAIEKADALGDDDTISGYFGASLFIITGVPGLYSRVEKHIHNGWIDFGSILEMGLSTGENILVSLAGNLYNGGFFERYTPNDIIGYCDADMTELAAKAILLRKQRLNVNEIYD
jgi:hypothetical protein